MMISPTSESLDEILHSTTLRSEWQRVEHGDYATEKFTSNLITLKMIVILSDSEESIKLVGQ